MNEARPGMPAGVPPLQRPSVAPAIPRPVQHPAPAQAPRQVSPVPAAPGVPGSRPGMAPAPVQRPPAAPAHPQKEDDAIALIEDGEDAATLHKKIKAFGADTLSRKHDWRRQIANTGKGPVRVRSFHAKLSDQGLEYLDDAINQWLDEHPDVDVKFVTSTTGMFDGKFKDLALILNVWY